MVQLRTKLAVVDNSGVKYARRIQVQKTIKRPGQIGDYVIASVVKATPESSFKKGQLVQGYLVTSVYGRTRPTGVHVRFAKNGRVLVTKKREPCASRVLVALPHDLRRKGRLKRLTLASHIA